MYGTVLAFFLKYLLIIILVIVVTVHKLSVLHCCHYICNTLRESTPFIFFSLQCSSIFLVISFPQSPICTLFTHIRYLCSLSSPSGVLKSLYPFVWQSNYEFCLIILFFCNISVSLTYFTVSLSIFLQHNIWLGWIKSWRKIYC